MSLRIIKTGILDTIQDDGRMGYQYMGINPGGTMDKLSARMTNILVGNQPGDAVIELHFPASEFFFEQPALIAIGGADFTACINGDEIPCLQPLLVSKYSILQFYRVNKGARAYLAIHKSFAIPSWLGSYSTNLKIPLKAGQGKLLQKDDEIAITPVDHFAAILGKKEFQLLPWKADADWENDNREEIGVIPGREWDKLTGHARQQLLDDSFTISSQSDRMGFRLQGKKLSWEAPEEMVSSTVCFGTVQLLPNGQLIVLMADHQTTGGYPRILHVIAAHQPRLAQKRADDSVKFRIVDLSEAESLYLKQQQHLQQLQHACQFRLDEFLSRYR